MVQNEEQARRVGRPSAGGPTPSRSVRLGEVYDEARDTAKDQNEKIADVIERKLQHYVEGDLLREFYDTCMAEFLTVHARRKSWEEATGLVATPAILPREILVPWRHALSQLRFVRAQYRARNTAPPTVPADMPWLDERVMELKTLEDGNLFWVQTDAPKGSPFA